MKARSILFAAAAAASSFTCGSDGDQPVPARTTIKWVFDSYPALGIPEGDNCTDLGISTVQVAMAGPMPMTLSDGCTIRQVVFSGLTPGAYTATLTPIDVNGMSLVKAPTTLAVEAKDVDSEAVINVPWDAWTTAYKGAYYFKIKWGGVDCATAMPVVVMQAIALDQNGAPTALKSDTGQKLDGTDWQPCRTGDELVLQMPFGPATIEITGKDAAGATPYPFHQKFDTFVGAGPTNPTIVYDVPGPPDAMPPDAMPPDAMPDAM